MEKILMIIPYFGKWPVWFDAYLLSIKKNESINWLIPTDCIIPDEYPSNIKFIEFTLPGMNKYFNDRLGFNVELNYRKFCDLKATYGHVFAEELVDYDFWGICDLDIIWGNIRKYITYNTLNHYDIISSRTQAISGHFNLFRNTSSINYLYRKIKNYKTFLSQSKCTRFDEEILTSYLSNDDVQKAFRIKWDEFLVNAHNDFIDSHQEFLINEWKWNDGELKNISDGKEVMYLHFINWKRTMKSCEIYNTSVKKFYVSFNSITLYPQPIWRKTLQNFINIFNGYWIQESRRIYFKRLKRKIQKRLNILK